MLGNDLSFATLFLWMAYIERERVGRWSISASALALIAWVYLGAALMDCLIALPHLIARFYG